MTNLPFPDAPATAAQLERAVEMIVDLRRRVAALEQAAANAPKKCPNCHGAGNLGTIPGGSIVRCSLCGGSGVVG